MKIVAAMFCWLLLLPAGVSAQGIAYLEELSGKVQLVRVKALKDDQGRSILSDGDKVITGPGGRATVVYANGTSVRVFESTQLKVEATSGLMTASLLRGGIWANIPKKTSRTRFALRTAEAVVGIKGTSLALAADPSGTHVGLSAGVIEVRNGQGKIDLTPGNMLQGVQREGSLQDKVKPLPFHLQIVAPSSINLAQEASMKVRLRLVSRDGSPLPQGNLIYIFSNLADMQKPQAMQLDEAGQASFELIFPSQQTDQTELALQAVMEDRWDVEVGQAVVALQGTTRMDSVKGLREFGEE